MLFCRLLFFFQKSTSLKSSFRNTTRVLKCLDPDLLAKLSAEDTRGAAGKILALTVCM